MIYVALILYTLGASLTLHFIDAIQEVLGRQLGEYIDFYIPYSYLFLLVLGWPVLALFITVKEFMK